MRKISNISYGTHKENLLDLYLPESESFDVFLYLHGGGLEGGDKNGDTVLYEYLASHGIAAATADYRMYPSAHYPDFIEDAAAAAAWLKTNIHLYGNCRRIFIGGSSAGGYLSMMLCFDERWLSAHGLTPCDFAGFVHDAGQPTAHFNVLRERGIDSRRIIADESAPVYHIGTAKEYPPMLFIVSDNDMKNRYEQTMMMLCALEHFGYDASKIKHTVMHGGHCEYVGKKDASGESILGKMTEEFIKDM